MSAALFDPHAVMKAVRAAVGSHPPATSATSRQKGANVAMSQLSQQVTRPSAPTGECRNVATVATPRASTDADDEVAAIEERAGLAADRVPAVYLDAWARLQCQRPPTVVEAEWRLAINDAALFLDAWGTDAAAMRWGAGELFDVHREGWSGGLAWQLKGERVEALGEDHARLSDGRTFCRSATGAPNG